MAAWTQEERRLPDERVAEDKLGLLREHGRVALPLLGMAWVAYASQEMPPTSVPRIRPSRMSTPRALRPSGARNAPTASETASIPVSEAPPLAKRGAR